MLEEMDSEDSESESSYEAAGEAGYIMQFMQLIRNGSN